jgi:PEP-CTERM motif
MLFLPMNRRHTRCAFLVVAVLSVAAHGTAASVTFADTQLATETYSLDTGAGLTITHLSPTFLSLSKFDPSLGTLESVAFDFSTSTYTDAAKLVDQAQAGSLPVHVQVRGLTWSASINGVVGGTTVHGAAAGFDDFGFVCGFCATLSPGQTVTRTVGGALPFATTLTNLDLNDFLGSGAFSLVVTGSTVPDGALGFELNGFTLDPGPQFHFFIDAELDATVVGTVTYTFNPAATPVPEPGTLTLCAIGVVTAVRRRRSIVS